jgi:homoserine acetyltransferase
VIIVDKQRHLIKNYHWKWSFDDLKIYDYSLQQFEKFIFVFDVKSYLKLQRRIDMKMSNSYKIERIEFVHDTIMR